MNKKRSVIAVTIVIAALLITSFLPLFPPEGGKTVFFDRSGLPALDSSYEKDGAVGCSAEAAIVVSEGFVLYSRNSGKKLGMASTTKIMTALVTIENASLDAMITIPAEAVGIQGSSIYLSEGESMTVRELLYGLMLESGNDSAVALAIAVAGSEDSFVGMMNDKAARLGMDNTHYVNPHGLSDDAHYTTASDMALLAAAALENSTFAEIVSTKRATVCDGKRSLVNHNKLLFSYEGAVGVKNGYTRATGRCLVTAAVRNGITVIAVTLNDSSDLSDHRRMLDYGFSVMEEVELAPEAGIRTEVNIVGGVESSVKASNTERIAVVLPKEAAGKLTSEIVSGKFVYAPVERSDAVAALRIFADGKAIGEAPLYAEADVAVKKVSLFERLFGFLWTTER